uniref:hypothetical protein n=1 Tax=Microbacterium sp. SORGH_AS_1204 TaxID=3041785 RepID=UPI0027D7C88D|nr:hypothetical protein [Microbacterium sp. SORGH_AS_1204]
MRKHFVLDREGIVNGVNSRRESSVEFFGGEGRGEVKQWDQTQRLEVILVQQVEQQFT